MFDHLYGYRGIIVTGPQRAGTTITAQMVAHDLQRRFVDEADVEYEDLNLVRELSHGEPYVLQAPCLCYCAHQLSGPEIAVLLVRRDLAEIQASQDRVAWQWESAELVKYGLTSGSIAEVKYAVWDRWQRPCMGSHAYEVSYSDLQTHPLWVPGDLRKRFGVKQTRP